MKNEPVLIIMAIIAVLQVVVGALTNHLEVTGITAALTAVGAVFQRQSVTPNSRVRTKNKK